MCVCVHRLVVFITDRHARADGKWTMQLNRGMIYVIAFSSSAVDETINMAIWVQYCASVELQAVYMGSGSAYCCPTERTIVCFALRYNCSAWGLQFMAHLLPFFMVHEKHQQRERELGGTGMETAYPFSYQTNPRPPCRLC